MRLASTPFCSAFTACAWRVKPSSDMAMLRESSTSTAMMFCCGFNSATVMAGCHSSTSTSAASSVCRPQMTQARQLRITGAACAQAGADQPRQTRGRGQDQQHQHPLRPCPKQGELAARIHRARILKKELEHGLVGCCGLWRRARVHA